jgi:hypothetical protein
MGSGSNDFETLTQQIKTPANGSVDLEVFTGGHIRWVVKGGVAAIEMRPALVDPPAPTQAGRGVYFMRDRGDGIAQFCVRFKTGPIQILATEP